MSCHSHDAKARLAVVAVGGLLAGVVFVAPVLLVVWLVRRLIGAM